MKKTLTFCLIIIMIFMSTGCSCKDAKKFKNEYELLNNKQTSYGTLYREINVDKNNPYIYTTTKEVIEKINNNETFYLYIGDKMCPWCRSVIEKSIQVANIYSINEIYYLNIWDEDHNEILRDKYILDENNNLILSKKGTDDYYKLLEYFDELLSEYTLNNEDEVFDTGEKRIYAPSYIYIEKGKAVFLTTGISSMQENANDELTEEILKDEENKFKELFSHSNYCDKEC